MFVTEGQQIKSSSQTQLNNTRNTREQQKKIFQDVLNEVNEGHSQAQIQQIANELEEQAFIQSKGDQNRDYRARINTIKLKLKGNQGKILRTVLFNGSLTPAVLMGLDMNKLSDELIQKAVNPQESEPKPLPQTTKIPPPGGPAQKLARPVLPQMQRPPVQRTLPQQPVPQAPKVQIQEITNPVEEAQLIPEEVQEQPATTIQPPKQQIQQQNKQNPTPPNNSQVPPPLKVQSPPETQENNTEFTSKQQINIPPPQGKLHSMPHQLPQVSKQQISIHSTQTKTEEPQLQTKAEEPKQEEQKEFLQEEDNDFEPPLAQSSHVYQDNQNEIFTKMDENLQQMQLLSQQIQQQDDDDEEEEEQLAEDENQRSIDDEEIYQAELASHSENKTEEKAQQSNITEENLVQKSDNTPLAPEHLMNQEFIQEEEDQKELLPASIDHILDAEIEKNEENYYQEQKPEVKFQKSEQQLQMAQTPAFTFIKSEDVPLIEPLAQKIQQSVTEKLLEQREIFYQTRLTEIQSNHEKIVSEANNTIKSQAQQIESLSSLNIKLQNDKNILQQQNNLLLQELEQLKQHFFTQLTNLESRYTSEKEDMEIQIQNGLQQNSNNYLGELYESIQQNQQGFNETLGLIKQRQKAHHDNIIKQLQQRRSTNDQMEDNIREFKKLLIKLTPQSQSSSQIRQQPQQISFSNIQVINSQEQQRQSESRQQSENRVFGTQHEDEVGFQNQQNIYADSGSTQTQQQFEQHSQIERQPSLRQQVQDEDQLHEEQPQEIIPELIEPPQKVTMTPPPKKTTITEQQQPSGQVFLHPKLQNRRKQEPQQQQKTEIFVPQASQDFQEQEANPFQNDQYCFGDEQNEVFQTLAQSASEVSSLHQSLSEIVHPQQLQTGSQQKIQRAKTQLQPPPQKQQATRGGSRRQEVPGTLFD